MADEDTTRHLLARILSSSGYISVVAPADYSYASPLRCFAYVIRYAYYRIYGISGDKDARYIFCHGNDASLSLSLCVLHLRVIFQPIFGIPSNYNVIYCLHPPGYS